MYTNACNYRKGGKTAGRAEVSTQYNPFPLKSVTLHVGEIGLVDEGSPPSPLGVIHNTPPDGVPSLRLHGAITGPAPSHDDEGLVMTVIRGQAPTLSTDGGPVK